MAWPKGKSQPKRGGRAKGTPNKRTIEVKAAIEEAFVKLGGVAALLKWAHHEPTEFYRLWGKLIPRDLNVGVSGSLTLEQLVAGSTERQPGDEKTP